MEIKLTSSDEIREFISLFNNSNYVDLKDNEINDIKRETAIELNKRILEKLEKREIDNAILVLIKNVILTYNKEVMDAV